MTMTNKDTESPVVVCSLNGCGAGGKAEDGGHVFDIPLTDERGYRSNTSCRCGMDQMTYDCWFRPFP